MWTILLGLWAAKPELVILLVLTDLLTEGDVIGGFLSPQRLDRGQIEMLDEISDGLGQHIVAPHSSAEHLKTKAS